MACIKKIWKKLANMLLKLYFSKKYCNQNLNIKALFIFRVKHFP